MFAHEPAVTEVSYYFHWTDAYNDIILHVSVHQGMYKTSAELLSMLVLHFNAMFIKTVHGFLCSLFFFTNAWLQRYSHHYQMTQSTNNWIVTLKLRKYPHLCHATCYRKQTPDSKVHRADMGPTWVLSTHVGPINLVIREQHSKPWSCVVYSTCTDCFVRVGNVCLSLWFIVI